eukprot:gb/GECH01006571.1/.p1 GENE.gb/GECH01006571.1/~~gb/GECH01006571.1/.p1  ORF type:complete len:848 (+),score=133.22 gb/GECH01006571.1/:1-2544(+)
MDHDVSQQLLQLVKHSVGDNDTHRVQQLYDFGLKLLSSRLSSLPCDSSLAADRVRKKLLREGRQEAAARFSETEERLRSKAHLSHQNNLLHLVHQLSDSAVTGASTPTPSPLSTSLKSVPHPPASSSSSSFQSDRSQKNNSHPDITMKPIHAEKPMSNSSASEMQLVRDVVYSLQGIEGRHIRYDRMADAFAADMASSSKDSTRQMVRRITEVGWLFLRVKATIQGNSTGERTGLVRQSLGAALETELSEFYRLLAVLESQAASGTLTLRRLLVWTQEPLERLRIMAVVGEGVSGMHGGALVSAVHQYGRHGDRTVQELVRRLSSAVSRPIESMIRRWVGEGALEDPYEEFFVAASDQIPDEELWYHKYTLRRDMIPSSVPEDLAQRIMLIGKSINFIRRCCHDAEWAMDEQMVFGGEDLRLRDIHALEAAVGRAGHATHRHVMHLLFERFHLYEHLCALRDYLLLGQGDFVQCLMSFLGPDLNQPSSSLYRHNLLGILESAVRGSNAQYARPEVVGCLDVRVTDPAPDRVKGEDHARRNGEGSATGWEVFSLDYRVNSPIDTVLTKDAMSTYLRLFGFLWRTKRVENALSVSWRRHMDVSHMLSKSTGNTDIAALLHSCHILRHEMGHFVGNLQYFLMFEVLESTWKELEEDLQQAWQAGDLDQLIASHDRYLEQIMAKALLGKASAEIHGQIMDILGIILHFTQIQHTVYSNTTAELRHRHFQQEQHQHQHHYPTSQRSGGLTLGPGTPSPPTLMDVAGTDTPPDEQPMLALEQAREQLEGIQQQYKAMLVALMESMAHHRETGDNHEILRFLEFRLDWNDFYRNQTVGEWNTTINTTVNDTTMM